MEPISLRFADTGVVLPLASGIHAIGRTGDGGIGRVEDPQPARVRFCVDRRGVWLTIGDGVGGVHVNGRPVRRMAMLRTGDTVHVDGAEIVLAGDVATRAPMTAPSPLPAGLGGDPRLLLRGVGGYYHGRSFTLDDPRLVGSGAGCDIRIDDPAFPERHCRIATGANGIELRDLGSGEGSIVNGIPVRDALLRPGDQIVFDAHQRFVVEAPGASTPRDADRLAVEPVAQAAPDPRPREAGLRRSARRLPWLLLAAAGLAAALAALLLFGASG